MAGEGIYMQYTDGLHTILESFADGLLLYTEQMSTINILGLLFFAAILALIGKHYFSLLKSQSQIHPLFNDASRHMMMADSATKRQSNAQTLKALNCKINEQKKQIALMKHLAEQQTKQHYARKLREEKEEATQSDTDLSMLVEPLGDIAEHNRQQKALYRTQLMNVKEKFSKLSNKLNVDVNDEALNPQSLQLSQRIAATKQGQSSHNIQAKRG